MADTVSTKVMVSGQNRYVAKFTNISDGTGESDVVKVDRSTLTGPLNKAPAKLVIEEIWYNVQGFEAVRIEWDNTSGGNDELVMLATGQNYIDYRPYSGLHPASAASDVTDVVGDILFTTVSAGAGVSGDTYDILMSFRLGD